MSASQAASYWQDYRQQRDEDDYLRRRERARQTMAASRERARRHGRTFNELVAATGAERADLARLLAHQVAAGRVVWHPASRRYELRRDRFEPEVFEALLGRELS